MREKAEIKNGLDLIPGKRYKVTAEDCCLHIDLVGIFVSPGTDEETLMDDPETVIFDFGRVWGHHLEFEEV